MNSTPIPIDISNDNALLRLVEEMKRTDQPRLLKRDNELVAMLMPMRTASQRHQTLEIFDFRPLSEIKLSLIKAGYPETEVNDMCEALSELPQYADTGIGKSK